MEQAEVWELVKMPGAEPSLIRRVRADRVEQLTARLMQQEQDRTAKVMSNRRIPLWVREIIREVSAKHDISPGEMISDSRRRNVIVARNEAIYLVKSVKMALSSPVIGRWFGKDHTTILHCLSSHAAKYDLPKLTGFDLPNALLRKRIAHHGVA